MLATSHGDVAHARSVLEEALSDEKVQAWTRRRENEVAEKNRPSRGSWTKGKAKTKKKLKSRR